MEWEHLLKSLKRDTRMTPEIQSECLGLIQKYQRLVYRKVKERIRNEIYELMHPYLCKWIMSIYKDWGIYKQKGEVVSLSWEVFEYCLERYTDDYPIPLHFYTYSRYYLLAKLKGADENILRTHIKDLPDWAPFFTACGWSAAMDKILDLESFRGIIPEEYHSIFDDALHSLHPAKQMRRTGVKPSGLHKGEYYRVKKVLKKVIKLLLDD